MGRHHYSDSEYVFIAGDPADGFYQLVSGSVRAEASGRAFASRGPIRPGDLFGEEGFLLGEARAYSVVAEGAVAADFLKRNDELRLLSDRTESLTPVLEDLFAHVFEAAPEVASDDTPVL
ncbi:MAG: cyclic nucleotide-binding domain-containing protein [Alphaproteobacteria bacterium]